jgi:S-layer protein
MATPTVIGHKTTGTNALAYIASWSDLTHNYGFNAAAGETHWTTFGANEQALGYGRGDIIFDAAAYLAAWSDLRAAFGESGAAAEALATQHWLQAGILEIGYGRTFLTNTIALSASANTGNNFKGATVTAGPNDHGYAGMAYNDTYDGSIADSLSSFDNLDGGLGADTLNAVITSKALPSGLTIKNIETANVNTTGAGLIADVSGWTGLTQFNTISGSAGVEEITAAATTSVDASFSDNLAGALANKITGGKNVVVTATQIDADTITVGSATGNVTINAAINAAATAGTIAVTTTGGTTVSVTEVGGAGSTFGAVNVTDGGVGTTKAGTLSIVTLDGYKGASTIVSNALTSLTLANHANNADTVTVTNNLSAPTASTLSLSLNKVLGSTLDVSTGKVTVITATTTTADSTLAAITDNNLTTLNVAGTKALTLTSGAGLTGLTGIAVSGSAGFTAAYDVSAVSTNLASVTTSSTSGTVTLGSTTVTQGIGVSTAYTGGTGNDIITVGATKATVNVGAGDNTVYILAGTTALGSGGSVTSGSGSKDILFLTAADTTTLSTAGAVQTAFKGAVTGFEVLSVGAHAAPTTVDTTGFGIFHTVNLTGAAVADTTTVRNLASGDTINIIGANTGATTTTAGSTGSTGNDTLNIGFSQGTAAPVSFGAITTPNVENLVFNVTDSQATPVGYLNTTTITDVSLLSVTVSGNSGLNLGILTGATALTSFSASGVTGAAGVSVTTAANQYASTLVGSSGTGSDTINASAALAAVTISTAATGTNTLTGSSTIASTLTGGAGNDSLVGGAAIDTITAGSGATGNTIVGAGGADLINLTGSTGSDVIRYNTIATSAAADGSNVDVITGFIAGSDKINFAQGALSLTGVTTDGVGDAVVALAAVVTNATSVATIADVYTALGATAVLAASAADGTATIARVYNFTTGAAAGTYLVVNDATANFQAATDVVIHLVGTVGTITNADFTFNV